MPYKDLKTQRDYQARWMANRREHYLKDKVCDHCGRKEYLYLAAGSIKTLGRNHRIWSYSFDKRLKKYKVSLLLCRDCHLKHLIKLKRWAQCGTATQYRRGCRCHLCRHAHAKARAKTRQRNKERRYAIYRQELLAQLKERKKNTEAK